MNAFRFGAVLMMALLAGCASPGRPKGTFTFALMGDLQYDEREEKLFPKLLDAVNAEDLAFVVHVGDFKSGSGSPCTDALYLQRRTEFNQSRHPFILLPGDNDWVDCRRASNNAADPLERLHRYRQVFYPDELSLGKTAMPLLRQSAAFASDPVLVRYRENTMWSHGGVVFAALNVQGSNDNSGFDAASEREYLERRRANIEWLKLAVRRAREPGYVGLVIFMQANPGFEEEPQTVARSAYRTFLEAFEAEVISLAKPVLFAHGDTHQFRVDDPYRSPLDRRPIANVIRVETYGSPQIDWVRITVDPGKPSSPFGIASGNFAPQPGTD